VALLTDNGEQPVFLCQPVSEIIRERIFV